MQAKRFNRSHRITLLAAALLGASGYALADLNVGVILSTSGPGASPFSPDRPDQAGHSPRGLGPSLRRNHPTILRTSS